MPAFSASAPGKIILFGEHAVVYGEPAIAVPVFGVQAKAIITADIKGESGKIQIEAPDISLSAPLTELEANHPIRAAILAALGPDRDPAAVPACQILISSSIPTASGLGSGAAVSAAIIRALSAFLGIRLTDEKVSDLTFNVEKIHHGTPSGIDNTVIAYQQPIYYQKGVPFQFLDIPVSFSILIADSGIPGHTRDAVERVRQNWTKSPERYQGIFQSIGQITQEARELIKAGSPTDLGPLMDQNHQFLQELDISLPELDLLVNTARDAGALGAKISGGGLGGNIIALVNSDTHQISEALTNAGAVNTLVTSISA